MRGFFLAIVFVGAAAQAWRAPAVASFDEVWQTINDTFHDPAFGGRNWSALRQELRPKVEAAGSADEVRDIIRDLLGRLGQSHFALLSHSSIDALPGFARVPIDVRIVDNSAVVTRVPNPDASPSGLAPGETIVRIDERSMADVITSVEGPDDRTTSLEKWRRVNRLLHGDEGSRVRLVVSSNGKDREIHVTRTMPPGETVTLGNLPPLPAAVEARECVAPKGPKEKTGARVGVIGFSVWMAPLDSQIAAAIDRFRTHDGIVLDLRGNFGGLVAMMRGVAGHFIDEPLLIGTMRTRQAQLAFRVNPRTATADGRRVDVFRGRLAILVDELTGSTSETFAGGLQSLKRARIFGRQTMGQALPALTKQLPNGDVLLYAIGDFTTSTGRSLEGAGVEPDARIPLRIPSLLAGKDDVLDAALDWLDSAGGPRYAPLTCKPILLR